MRINLQDINQEDFRIITSEIAGDRVYLVNPLRVGVTWTKENLILRSSMWNDAGEPVSLGFPKFFNWEEHPHLGPAPGNLKDCNIVEKIDGSCLIVSFYKKQCIIRTRGTFNLDGFPTQSEITELKNRYPVVFDATKWTDSWSYIYEWCSPANQIIIKHEQPELYLIGMIFHKDYRLEPQVFLDAFAKVHHIPRPRRFSFTSIEDMIQGVEALDGQEGICVYYNFDQQIRKVKSPWYLALHRLKSELGSIERVIDLYFTYNKPTFQEFMDRIISQFDYETLTFARGHISNICDGMKQVNEIVEGMKRFVGKIKGFHATRKEQAEVILNSYGKTNRASFVFMLLDGKELDNNAIKKLLYQVLKKQ